MDNNQIGKHQIHGLFIKFLHQQEQYEERESEAFLEDLRKNMTFEGTLNMTEIHVIACIGENEPINLTSIADKMELSKGNISKVSSKLLKNGWLRKTQLSDNKKEIFFRLTPMGKKLFTIHEELHGKAQQEFFEFLNQYSETEQDFLKRLLLDFSSFLEKKTQQGTTNNSE